LRSIVVSCPRKLADWLDKKGITERRVKHGARALAPLLLLVLVSILLALLWILWHYYLSEGTQKLVKDITRALTGFGEWLNLSSPGDFVVTLMAEIFAFAFATIVARMFAREPKLMAPRIALSARLPHTGEDGAMSYFVFVSNEEGETAALQCEAQIIFPEIGKNDVLDVVGARFSSSNFPSTVKAHLLWDDGDTERTLRSGDDTEIEVLRLIPARNGVEAHFEVPSSDKSWKSTICLRLTPFYPMVRIVPLNGRHTTHYYELHESQSKKWVLRFDEFP
jgi:hypothetical protein